MGYINFFLHQLLVVFFLGTFTVTARAQVFFAQKQSTVDSFPIIAGTADLYGSIILNGTADTANDIHDLTPLLQLKVLTGSLSIVNTTRLKSLHGLDSLVYIGGLLVRDNDSLANLSHLNPQYIDADFVEISQNKGLEEIKGLNKNTYFYEFRIQKNPRLKTINGLQALREFPYINISENDALETVSMPNLQTANDFWLYKNKNLQTLSFPKLDTLKYFSALINIWHCPRLKNLDGIKPKFVEGYIALKLFDNDSLQNIDAVGQWPAQTMHVSIVRCHQLDSVNLPNVKKTIGQLYSKNNALKSIRLDNVETAQYGYGATAVSISYNPELVDISMPKLKTIVNLKDSISISHCPKLRSLQGFGSLENVNGRILLKDLKSVKNLHGFEKLRYCGAGFEIGSFYNGSMDSLENLCNFEHFEYTRLDFQLINCRRLSSLQGLETFRRTGFLRLEVLDSLKSLEGLNNLETLKSDSFYLSGWLYIDSTGLEDISALKNIQEFGPGPYIRIQNSQRLQKAAFPHLTQAFEIWARNCAILNDIQFLALTKMYAANYNVSLFLENLPSLTSLDGFKTLKTFNAGGLFGPISKIRIKNNPLLTDCAAICQMRKTIAASFFDLQNNAFPCSALSDIEANICDSLTAVSGPETKAVSGIQVTPNPAQDIIELSWLPSSENKFPDLVVTLVSSTGQVLIAQKISGADSRVDVSQVPSGFYFLQVSSGGQRLGSKKIAVFH